MEQSKSSSLPKVSALMPVYNAAPFLTTALESLLAQTFHDFEVVIVDDGSTDGCADILAGYAARDARIRILRHAHNLGIVRALNTGLDACRGDYIARMDADDVALPDRLARQLDRMVADPAIGALGGAVTYIDSGGKELGLIRRCSVQASPLAGNPLLHPTVMVQRAALVQHGLHYRERYRYAEDYFLWLELRQYASLAALEDVVLQYRIHATASRRQHLKDMLRATLRVKRDAIAKLGIRPGAVDLARMASESFLLLLPIRLVWWLYRRLNRIDTLM